MEDSILKCIPKCILYDIIQGIYKVYQGHHIYRIFYKGILKGIPDVFENVYTGYIRGVNYSVLQVLYKAFYE